jgi:hypothetical protein
MGLLPNNSATPSRGGRHQFPVGRKFAFTVVDDTDFCAIETVKPVYDFLLELGVRTTKTVWSLAATEEGWGATLQDSQYRAFVRDLQNRGVELALHNVRHGTATRAQTIEGLSEFQAHLGSAPRVHCNHESNHENLYWGASRLRPGLLRGIHRVSMLLRDRESAGHIPESEYFWGDLCRQHISYTRNFVFREINLDCINPSMPYHDPAKPWAKAWFSSCDGEDVERFCQLIREDNQQRLESEGGVCIVYTHFAYGFFENGKLHPEFERLMRLLAGRNGWFVPVSELLDHLRSERQSDQIPAAELARMERIWLTHRLQTKFLHALRIKRRSWDGLRNVRVERSGVNAVGTDVQWQHENMVAAAQAATYRDK